jgi:hypothetical protein
MARRLLAALGNPTVEKRLEGVEADAAEYLAALTAVGYPHSGRSIEGLSDVKRWVQRSYEVCSNLFAEPSPPSLVKLNAMLMGVKGPRTARKNPEAFYRLVEFDAAKPGAAIRAAARVLKCDPKTIRAWRRDPEYHDRLQAARRDLEDTGAAEAKPALSTGSEW